MTAEPAQREPTMEEILASIRRIISEEDAPGARGGDALVLQAEPEPVEQAYEEEFEPEPEPPPAPAVAAKAPPVDDLMVVDQEAEPELPPAPAPAAPPPAAPQMFTTPRSAVRSDDTLVAEPVAQQAAGALGRLMGSMLVSSGATLDDVVRELLKPMLKEWLEAHLPQIVEAEVAREIERIRRMAR
jgi:cell pole-organizing protein PopZ